MSPLYSVFRPAGMDNASQEQWQTQLPVSDDGIGIPEEALPHIFERFFRVDTARDRSGIGLGLSIVDWIVQTHDGKIEVQSELGKGTTFRVTLPCEEDVLLK